MAKIPGKVTGKERAMHSARNRGAVGVNAVVPRVVRMFALPHQTILDYGAGPDTAHTLALRAAGFNVTAHDYHAEKPEIKAKGLHDADALKRRYHIVFASNVLNTQDSRPLLAKTLNEIAASVHPTEGMAIVNLTASPRYDAFKGMTNQEANKSVELSLKRRFHSVERHPMGTSQAPVWIAKNPKNPVHPIED